MFNISSYYIKGRMWGYIAVVCLTVDSVLSDSLSHDVDNRLSEDYLLVGLVGSVGLLGGSDVHTANLTNSQNHTDTSTGLGEIHHSTPTDGLSQNMHSENGIITRNYSDSTILPSMRDWDRVDVMIDCGTGRTWDGDALQCEPVECPTPSLKNHVRLQSSQTSYIYENKVNQECKKGYIPTNKATTLECGHDAKWSGTKLTCKPVECPPPSLKNHVRLTSPPTSHIYETKVNQECKKGYKPTNKASTLKCGHDAKWSGTKLTCEPVECPLPSLKNNVRLKYAKASYTYKSEVNQECKIGYKSTNQATTLACGHDAKWSGTKLICDPVKCGTPILNAHVHIDFSKSYGTHYQSNIHQTCDHGYKPTSRDSKRTCGSDGKWSGPKLICEPETCGRKPKFDNGYYIGGNTYEDTAIPLCNTIPGEKTEFVQTGGDGYLTCNKNGRWVGEVAICQEMCLLDNLHAKMSEDGNPLQSAFKEKYTVGETVTYSCRKGRHGSLIYTCHGNGKGWVLKRGICQQVCLMDNLHPGMTRKGQSLKGAYKERYAIGETVSYTCPGGWHGSGTVWGCGGDGGGWRQNGDNCYRSCFPANSTVVYPDGSTRRLSEIGKGDIIMTADPETLAIVPSRVTGFTYRDVAEKDTFLIIALENNQMLTVTDYHYTFVKSSPKMASKKTIAGDVKVGDYMHVSDANNRHVNGVSKVLSISKRENIGVISPITETGTVIVDGVYMSCFCQN